MALNGFFLGGVADQNYKDQQLGLKNRALDVREHILQLQQQHAQNLAAQQAKEQDFKAAQMGIGQHESIVESALKAADLKGIPRTDPRVQNIIESNRRSAVATAQAAEQAGVAPAGYANLVDQKFQALLFQPTHAQEVTAKAKEAGAVAGAQEAAKVAANPPQTNLHSGLAYGPNGETRNAYFDPHVGHFMFSDGTPLPQGWKFAPAQVQAQNAEGLGLTKPSQTAIQKKLLNTQDLLSAADLIQQTYKPEYQTLPVQLKMWTTAAIEKLGGQISPEQKQQLLKYTEFRANAYHLMNTTIKNITGAQMSEQEATRILKEISNPEKDSPTQFIGKLHSVVKRLRLAAYRYQYALNHGLISVHDAERMAEKGTLADYISSKISLGQMDQIVNQRGDEIAAKLKQQGVPADQIPGEVIKQLRTEFGG